MGPINKTMWNLCHHFFQATKCITDLSSLFPVLQVTRVTWGKSQTSGQSENFKFYR